MPTDPGSEPSAAHPNDVVLAPLAGLKSSVRLTTHAPDRDLVSHYLHDHRVWEPFETRLWLAAQRPGDVVMDVGANLGYFSVLSACNRKVPGAVFAFEPAADNFALLQRNLAQNDCGALVRAEQVALGNRDEASYLHRSDDNLGDHQTYPGDGERSTEPIRICAGARLLGAMVEHIDLLKIDTQGSEYAVVEGLGSLLLRSRDTLRLLLELTPYSLALAGSSGRALVELLAGLDLPMAIVDHIEHRLVPSDAAALATWCDNVEQTPEDRGFMNIFVGEAPAL